MRKTMPGGAARFICVLLTFLLTAVLLTLALVSAWLGVSTNQALWLDAMHQASEAHEAVWQERVSELGDQYGFSPDTLLNAVSSEDFDALAKDMASWMTRTLRAGADVALPSVKLDAVKEALNADESLMATQGERTAASLVNGKLGEAVAAAMRESLLPLRGSLLHTVFDTAETRLAFRHDMAILPWLPVVLGLCALLLCLLMLLLCARCPARGGMYIGCALIAAVIVLAAACGALTLLRPLDAVRSVSALFAAELGTVLRHVLVRLGIVCLAALAAGIVLMRLNARTMRRRLRHA